MKKKIEYYKYLWYYIFKKQVIRRGIIVQDIAMKNFYEQISKERDINKSNINSLFINIISLIKAYHYYRQIKKIAKKQDYSNYIAKDKKILNGKATIKGTRIEPITILYFTFKNKVDFDVLKENYPCLDDDTIRVALLYAIKNTSFRNTLI